jgi:hypothetical protein
MRDVKCSHGQLEGWRKPQRPLPRIYDPQPEFVLYTCELDVVHPGEVYFPLFIDFTLP